jgi:hypothetical protein
VKKLIESVCNDYVDYDREREEKPFLKVELESSRRVSAGNRPMGIGARYRR